MQTTTVPDGDGFWLVSVTFLATSSQPNSVFYVSALSSANMDAVSFTGVSGDVAFEVKNFMQEIGSTASQFVVTSGSPASNGDGNWWLEFDGLQTRMNFSSIPFSPTIQAWPLLL